MPPRTRSQGMEETYSEGDVGPSHSKPDGDLLSMMTQMMADLKDELRSNAVGLRSEMTGVRSKLHGLQSHVKGIRNNAKESEIRKQTIHKTLFEEVHTFKKSRSSRPPTPREYHIPNVIPKEYNGKGGMMAGMLGIGVVIGRMNVLGWKMEYMVNLAMEMGGIVIGNMETISPMKDIAERCMVEVIMNQGTMVVGLIEGVEENGSQGFKKSLILEGMKNMNVLRGMRGQWRGMLCVECEEDLAPDVVIVTTLKVALHHGRRTHLILSLPRRVHMIH
ncbi:hypothetical protein AAHA92_22057 [Salvia divinorum]|uniref:Uncharacterized protein n=1 Tax=Salvia divinorum TaxID=28513 RepID=A0ABD1GNM6_SALDI